jgi:hypothetical protein
MSKRHGATISLFLIIGGIFFIGPVIGVLISGIGAAWGIWGNESKQAEGNLIQLTELYHLIESPEGPRLVIKKGILPDRNLGRPGFDSMAVVDNFVFTSRGLTYGIAQSNGTWHEFEDRNLYMEHLNKEQINPPVLHRFDEFKKSIKTVSP